MTDHFLTRAKAYAALVGTVVTLLLSVIPADSNVHAVLVIAGVLATGIATYRVPNKVKA